MEDIFLIHRKSAANSFAQELPVWRTCLRQILFCAEKPSQESSATAVIEEEALHGESALQFLLEVLCGLHSPVLGETEVFGQFRLFVEERRTAADPLFSQNQKWLKFVFSEVKRIRSGFINGLGSNSYGGLVRKISKDFSSVTVLGSGHLAQEILPWLSSHKDLQMISRRPQELVLPAGKLQQLKKLTYEDLQRTAKDSAHRFGEVVIVAAPLADSEILRLLSEYGQGVRLLFDLRGDVLKPISIKNIKLHSLADLFAELNASRKENEEKIAEIKAHIAGRVTQFMERSELRPMGWDDICA